MDRFPEPGETLSGNQFRKGTGGKAANACVQGKSQSKPKIQSSLIQSHFQGARLGLSCRMLAKVRVVEFGLSLRFNLLLSILYVRLATTVSATRWWTISNSIKFRQVLSLIVIILSNCQSHPVIRLSFLLQRCLHCHRLDHRDEKR